MGPELFAFTKEIDKLPAFILLYREKIIYANRFTRDFFGYSLDDLQKRYVWDFISDENIKKDIQNRVLQRISGKYFEKYEKVFTVSTTQGHFLLKGVADTIQLDGQYYGVLVSLDCTDELKETKLLENIFKYAPDIIVQLDRNGIIKVKSNAVTILGYDLKDVVGKNIFDFIHPDDKEKFQTLLSKAFDNKGKSFFIEYRVLNAKGRYVWLEGNITVPPDENEAILIERDITQRKKIQEKILHLTYFDPLTKLPNRVLFEESLRGVVFQSRYVALIMVKITNVEQLQINCTKKEIFHRLKEIFEQLFSHSLMGITLMHEFMIAFPFHEYEEYRQLDTILKKLQTELSSFEACSKKILIHYNIGIALYPKSAKNTEDLINLAQIALYQSIKKGPNNIEFFSKDIQKKYEREQKILEYLPNAIKNRELQLFYQPIFDIKTLQCIGFETLIRWFSKELGIVPPSEFIPIAETNGFISEITDFVLESAMGAMQEFKKSYFIAVNFSAKDFKSQNLIDRIVKKAKNIDFDLSRLVMEITETTAMEDPELAKIVIQKAKSYGIQVALDDFGTGYSSMSYLSSFDVDKIKIDLSFVIDIVTNKKNEFIVRTIIDLAHSLGAKALAEGIENEEILEKLKSFGCDEGQGYYYLPSVSLEKIREFLGEKNEK
ncbi:sensor domain-containing protein [Nitratiruptor sp. SB155-2]|uniref:sensor domain-containing protein n=1 Tax=Nitratiruptor sp. (strain SB155-2) TaxID=387092 RepID=UPI0001586DF9|nr:EAL domain-containing protein [Nitratiruptor sp. SB155-2]BAF69125.1 signal transduction sensor histidine kinase [Nitratiruptor sp. SB155-2]